MRTCKQCQTTMVEDYDIMVEGGAYGIKISKGSGLFAKRLDKPKAAICPKCGEISLYLENPEEITNNEK